VKQNDYRGCGRGCQVCLGTYHVTSMWANKNGCDRRRSLLSIHEKWLLKQKAKGRLGLSDPT
jgi:radical SAM superfamily enzyme YgiQ (UPF0313 family)